MTKEKEKRFYAGFKTMRNQMPAVQFAQIFSKLFEHAAEKEFGEIIPNDLEKLTAIGIEVLKAMARTNRPKVTIIGDCKCPPGTPVWFSVKSGISFCNSCNLPREK